MLQRHCNGSDTLENVLISIKVLLYFILIFVANSSPANTVFNYMYCESKLHTVSVYMK